MAEAFGPTSPPSCLSLLSIVAVVNSPGELRCTSSFSDLCFGGPSLILLESSWPACNWLEMQESLLLSLKGHWEQPFPFRRTALETSSMVEPDPVSHIGDLNSLSFNYLFFLPSHPHILSLSIPGAPPR